MNESPYITLPLSLTETVNNNLRCRGNVLFQLGFQFQYVALFTIRVPFLHIGQSNEMLKIVI